jgi:hypothetical protein
MSQRAKLGLLFWDIAMHFGRLEVQGNPGERSETRGLPSSASTDGDSAPGWEKIHRWGEGAGVGILKR